MNCFAFAPSPAMTTTKLTRAIRGPEVRPCGCFPIELHQPLRVNWVVVIGQTGNRTLQMRWVPSADSS